MKEAEIKKTAEEVKKVLTDGKAKVVEEKALGQKELAYEIKAQKRGYYVVVTLEAENDAATREFDRVAKINAKVIRHLVVRLEK